MTSGAEWAAPRDKGHEMASHYVALGPHSFGAGEDEKTARKNCRRAGAAAKVVVRLDCPEPITFRGTGGVDENNPGAQAGVNPMDGGLWWLGPVTANKL